MAHTASLFLAGIGCRVRLGSRLRFGLVLSALMKVVGFVCFFSACTVCAP